MREGPRERRRSRWSECHTLLCAGAVGVRAFDMEIMDRYGVHGQGRLCGSLCRDNRAHYREELELFDEGLDFT